ncbi:Fic family protein, partial [Corynebacterium coyleae]|nr:Fic family protein [Corynebacterium coyleae]
MICLKLATRTGSFQVDVDATPPDCGVANINYERKPLAVPGTWNTGTNYADS